MKFKSLIAVAASIIWFASCSPEKPRILLFSKAAAYTHESIKAGQSAILALAKKNNLDIDTTRDASIFTDENLGQYSAVIFLHTTGNVLDANQQASFKRYIQAGGGFVGIHAAADSEYDWLWYGKMLGAYFTSHPPIQEAVLRKATPDELSDGLPDEWELTDEWYNYKTISLDIKVLYSLDESTYTGGENGASHPITWYHEFDGGRSFYTGLGHRAETFSEPLFLQQLEMGIVYAVGDSKPDYSKATALRAPDENRFTKVVLGYNFDEPTEMAMLPDGRIMFLERKGRVKLYDPTMDSISVINEMKVYTTYEDGMIGLTLDPVFEENHWLYIFYSHPNKAANVISRFTFNGKSIDLESEKEVLEVGVQRVSCCHTGGSLAFGPDGNLYASTGDNTNPFESDGYSPADERPDRFPFDAQKSSSNPNDLRGKILRIKPQPDGTYAIPEGNLFPKGTPGTRSEIYVMGCRNPYRISIDQKTGYLYWGEVGPDAGNDDAQRGPRGFDEVNQAKGPGFFGWPLFVGNNYAYAKYDFERKTIGPRHDPLSPMNTSPNNTGIRELPPAQPAFIWYPYAESPDFPLVGTGGRNAMAGPVYHSEFYKDKPGVYPPFFDDKLITYDWMRGWMMINTMDKAGKLMDMERFMPHTTFNNIIDMVVGIDGKLYTLEYGKAWFKQNMDARLSRIDYNGGNRLPMAKLNASALSGSVPLAVSFDASESSDPDGDSIRYTLEWAGKKDESKTPKFNVTFDKPGEYHPRLTVTDSQGAASTASISVVAGNSPPVINIAMEGNSMFFLPNSAIRYSVGVSDREDGSTGSRTIPPKSVRVSFDYLAKGFDLSRASLGHVRPSLPGMDLIAASDCKSCHLVDQKSAGPAFRDVARRYVKDLKAVEILTEKVLRGGSGVWGTTAMAAHPQLSKEQAQLMVEYVLSLAMEEIKNSLPIDGVVNTGNEKEGAYILQATYTDRGGQGVPSLSDSRLFLLKKPTLEAAAADQLSVAARFTGPTGDIVLNNVKHNASALFKSIDLTNISFLEPLVYIMEGQAGGEVEVYLDGVKVGTTSYGRVPGVEVLRGVKMKSTRLRTGRVSGLHDIQLVFKNDKAGNENLFFFGKVELGR